MSKENAQLGEDLGTDVATATAQATDAQGTDSAVATEKKARVKKVLSAEEIVAVGESIEIIKTIPGLSENFVKILAVVPQWTNAEANKSVKEEVAVEFEGLDKLKAYVADAEGFAKDVAILSGIKEVISALGAVKSFYSRTSAVREKKGGKKVQVNIKGTLYKVNAEFMLTIADLEKEEKIKRILAHASLETVEAIELL